MNTTSTGAHGAGTDYTDAELRHRATIAEDEFVHRMHALRNAEADGTAGELDANNLIDRLHQALSTPYDRGADGWDDLIEGFAADLFRDDRWNGAGR